jgi:hypothetical protein
VGEAEIVISCGQEARLAWQGLRERPTEEGTFAPASGGGHVMRISTAGEYWVRGGCEIFVSPASGADAATVRLFLLGSALGMALHQRGLLVLHGASVRHGSGATIFVGDSGEGKSTLAAALGRVGHAILGDDTMPLWPCAGGGFEVWPGSRMFKLWSDTIAALGGDAAGLESVGDRIDKFFVPNAAEAPDAPVRVRSVVVLSAEGEARPRLQRLQGLEAIRALATNTYRPEYVPLLGWEAAHFRLCSELAGAVPVSRLTRTWDIARLGETIDLLGQHWARGAEDRV